MSFSSFKKVIKKLFAAMMMMIMRERKKVLKKFADLYDFKRVIMFT
jgi:hypothetical protein